MNDSPGQPGYVWYEIDDLYHKVLALFYEKGQRLKAAPHALHLLRMLDEHDPTAETLLGMSGRWLVAEMDGDSKGAVRYREKEIAVLRGHIATGLLEAGALAADEYSDRLDMLAANYLDLKRYDDALAALAESEAFCKEHGLPFDGKDIRADVRRAVRRKRPGKVKAG